MSSSDPSTSPDAPPRRRKRKDYSLLVLAAGIFLFGAAAVHNLLLYRIER